MRLRRFFQLFSNQRMPRKIVLRHAGQHYDLKAIYDEINRQYFEGKLSLNICWFGSPQAIARTKIVFGAYHGGQRLIKIHRRLDRKEIPLYFVSFIVYHEMLHYVEPPISSGRRRQVHHKAFREKEKRFSDYLLAKKFREEWVKRLREIS